MDKPDGFIKLSFKDIGNKWQFGITDNGPGIDKKHHERIFRIFQTLHPRDEVESTGIGLTLVKKIVELHGGTVWVESEVGVGSTFYFTLAKSLETNVKLNLESEQDSKIYSKVKHT